MNTIMKTLPAACLLAIAILRAGANELPYQFHGELETVHEPGIRDVSLMPQADEFSFSDGMVVSVPKGKDFLRRVAADFADFLAVSHGVSVRVAMGEDDATVTARIDTSMSPREYRYAVSRQGVKIAAADERAAAQAFYHLEDLMNLRMAPFLKFGDKRRRTVFAPRMIHSGWGIDTFPEPYLIKAAHHGFDAILVFVPEAGRTQRGWDDINAIIARAAKWGLDTYLYSYVRAPIHPSDPQAERVFDETYGAIARAYPAARGYIFVGESCQFPSRDPRTNGKIRPNPPEPGDTRPYPCMYPCSDYPDWLRAVKRSINRYSPGAEIVFWTYNFGSKPADARLALLRKMPKDVTLLVTFEMFHETVKANGLKSRVIDYSISDPGPGGYYLSEAEECGRLGLKLYTQANTAGLTWDLGTVPYLPCPYQWKKRWDALRASHDRHHLSGLMEGHHYGWVPSFVTELSKEAFTEGGMPFERHIRLIAARDYGEKNVDSAIAAWKGLSDAIADSFPCPQNLCGPYRIGPAMPFNFTTNRIEYSDVPFPKASPYVKSYCWTYFNYLEDFSKMRFPPVKKTDWQPDQLKLEAELLEGMIGKCEAAADAFAAMAPAADKRRAGKARRMSDLARYMARCWTTTRNLKLGVLAHLAGDAAAMKAAAQAEYANKAATLELVDRNSRLGWEPSMDYMGGRAMIEWSMKLMRDAYDISRTADKTWTFPEWEDDTYVFLPACAYDGNKAFERSVQQYPPKFDGRKFGPVPQMIVTDIPKLEPDGSGMIEITTGDLATPCAGFWFPKANKGVLIFTEQQFAGYNLGYKVSRGSFVLSAPASRTKGYRFCRPHVLAPDKGQTLPHGVAFEPRVKEFRFDAPDLATFYETFFRNRKCLLRDERSAIGFTPELIQLVHDRKNADGWREAGDTGYWAPELGNNWMPGWTGGLHTAFGMCFTHGSTDALTYARAQRTIDHLVGTQTSAGFYAHSTTWVGTNATSRFSHIRCNADALYHLLKFADRMKMKPAWLESAQKACDAYVRMWRRYGDWGMFVNDQTGELVMGGTASAALVPAALAKASALFGRQEYMAVAEESGLSYHRRFVERGISYGGPCDALLAPDSESAAALLESAVTLAETTRNPEWVARARAAAAYMSSWIVSYRYRFPETSEFGRLGMNTVGAVWANCQNKHAAPGICTLSGDSLKRLAALTGDAAYQELFEDVASCLPQTISTVARPIRCWNGRWSEPGWINERINMSDWEGFDRVGGIFYSPCWCMTSFLLTAADLDISPSQASAIR